MIFKRYIYAFVAVVLSSMVVVSCFKMETTVDVGFSTHLRLRAYCPFDAYFAGVKVADDSFPVLTVQDSSMGLAISSAPIVASLSSSPFGETRGGTSSCAYDTMRVWGSYGDGPWEDGISTVNYCADIFTRDAASGDWVSSMTYAKVASGKTLSFFALSPADADGSVVSSSSEGGEPVSSSDPLYLSRTPAVRITTPSEVSLQRDILATAAPVNCASDDEVNIPLTHILSGVRFVLGRVSEPVHIEAVEFRNYYSSRSYFLSGGWADGFNNNSIITAKIGIGRDFAPTAYSGEALGGASDIIFCVPQHLPRGCKVRVYFSRDRYDYRETSDSTLSESGWELKPGQMNTFTINL